MQRHAPAFGASPTQTASISVVVVVVIMMMMMVVTPWVQ